MSLLNEVLRDLDHNKPRPKITAHFLPKQKPSRFALFPFVVWWIAGSFFISMLVLGIVRLHHVEKIQPIRQTHLTPVSKPAVEKKTMPLASSLSSIPIMQTALLGPSRLLPAPGFEAKEILQANAEETSEGHLVDKDDSDADPEAYQENYLQTYQEPAPENAEKEPDAEEDYRVKKVFQALSGKEWYEDQLNTALQAIEEQDDARAIGILHIILGKFPSSMEARETLAAVYLSRDELAQAEQILDEGLRYEPRALRLSTMKARLLLEQNKPQDAFTLLDQFSPEIRKEPDFYGLKAVLLQALGRTNDAGSLYQALLKLEPSNGQYWLGYGIALESKHATQQAIAAYKRATQSEEIEPNVRAYAENRLKRLQG